MGLVAMLARRIAQQPEKVAAGTLFISLLLAGLSVLALVRSDVETDLSAFEIQGRPVGTKAMAADRFDDWAWNSTSAVTCFDLPPLGDTFDDGTATCADHVKSTPTECSEDSWKHSRCCASCVAAEPGRLGSAAWKYSAPADEDAGTTSGRRSLSDDTRSKRRTLHVVLRTTDGSSMLSAAHIKDAQDTRDAIVRLGTFKHVCDADYQLDNGDRTGGVFTAEHGHGLAKPGYGSSGCDGAGGVLYQLDKANGDLAATTKFYADEVWEGHYDMITNGYLDQYFSACNQTSTATTLYFYLNSDRPSHDAFMADVRQYATTQPLVGDGVEISFYESSDEDANFLRTLLGDTTYAAGAVGFVFLLMLLQTRSLIITVCGFVHILLSLPVGQFFYGIVLGIDWISFLQALPLFIIMGIGADDVFVFLDAWRRSTVDNPSFRDPNKLEERLTHVMEHSVKAMSITSVTTAAAFSAICLSPVAPLRTLGIFSGLVVLSNFALCITWFPAIVVTCYQHGLYKDAQPKLPAEADGLGAGLMSADGSSTAAVKGGRPLERFFALYAQQLHSVQTRRSVLVGSAVVTGIAIILAGQLAMPTAMPELFPPQSNSFMYEAAQDELFSFEKYPVPTSFVWGILPAETSKTGQRGLGIAPDDEDRIMPVFDMSVELDSEASQQAILTTCRLLIGAKSLVRGDVDCPMLSFAQWRQQQKPPLPFPVPQKDFAQEYGAWMRAEADGASRGSVLFDPDTGRLMAMYGEYSSVLDTNNGNADVMNVMAKTEQWFKDKDKTGASVFHSNALEYRGATLENISVSGMISLVAQLGMSLLVLLFATANWQVAVLSMCSILMTTIWSMSFMYIVGWSFGILEAICVTVLVGLVVDYVVHMGMSYLESPSRDRRQRTIYACVHMGISICSGAISTVGASVFLTCCTITFFPKFGIFMAVTIIFSFICAGVVFPAALMELGPEGKAGTLSGIFGGNDDPIEIEMDGGGDDDDSDKPEHDIDQPMAMTGGKGGGGAGDRQVTSFHVVAVCALILAVCTAIAYWICPPGETFCAALPAQTKEFEQHFAMPGFGVTSQQTTYECHGFDFPQDETYHVTEFEPIEDPNTKGVVHHMILYKSPIPASKCFRECLNMPSDSQLVWAWAVGMAAFPMPPDVGFPVGKFTDTSYTSLQIHYNNVFHTPTTDHSGVKMTLSTNLRKYAMGIMSLGRSPQVRDLNYPNLNIPPSTRYEAIVTCRCGQKAPLFLCAPFFLW
jgi:hypothetical protein